jgi:thiol-disulfide isomerase/thioredoxin
MTKKSLGVFFAVTLAATSLLTSGCSPKAGAAEEDSHSAYEKVAPRPAPAWKLVDLDGKTVSSADFKGKVVVVDFWATWCPPCVGEIPGYIEAQKKLEAQGFTLVGLSLDEIAPADVKKFVQQKGMNYPIVIANQDVLESFAHVEGIPATFVIDREGNIRFQKVGAAPIADLEKIAKSLL